MAVFLSQAGTPATKLSTNEATALAAPIDSQLRVIVQFKSQMGPVQHRQVRRFGGTLYHELPIINGAAYHISKHGLDQLLASGIVESYSFDQ